MATDNNGNIMGADLSAYLYRETQRRNTRLYIIETSPDQDAAIENKLREIAANEPRLEQNWSLALDNCSTRSNRGLDAGGILPTLGIGITSGGRAISDTASHVPGSAGFRVSHGYGPSISIPQGATWQPRSLTEFIKR